MMYMPYIINIINLLLFPLLIWLIDISYYSDKIKTRNKIITNSEKK